MLQSLLCAADITATLDTSNGSSAFTVRNSGNNPVATMYSDGDMLLDGTLEVSGAGSSFISGSLQLKGGLRLDAGGVECTTSEMLIVDGRLGLGVINPSYRLDVAGNTVNAAAARINNYGTGNGDALWLGNYSDSGRVLALHQKNSTGNIMEAYFDPGTGMESRMTLSNSGNLWAAGTIEAAAGLEIDSTTLFADSSTNRVGVGTDSPGYKLDVNGDARIQGGEIYGINGVEGLGLVNTGWFSDGTNLSARFAGSPGDFYVQSSGGAGTYMTCGSATGGMRLWTGTYKGNGPNNAAFIEGRSAHSISFNWTGAALQFIVDVTHVKTFVIDHPQNEEKYLVHGTLEGPEGAVYYRGRAQLSSGKAEVKLPSYFEDLTRKQGRTVLLTAINGFDSLAVKEEQGVAVADGKFTVISNNPASTQEFYWEVKAVRADVDPLCVEPFKKDTIVKGDGPYTYTISPR